MHKKILLVAAFIALLCGCSPQMLQATRELAERPVTMTYLSEPEGALITTVKDFELGRTPFTQKLYWTRGPFLKGQCGQTGQIKARWVSGASVALPNISICPQQGFVQHFTFTRPKNAPGLEADIQFADSQRQAALAAEAQAHHELMETIEAVNAATPTPQAQQSVHCTSQKSGGGSNATVDTDCR